MNTTILIPLWHFLWRYNFFFLRYNFLLPIALCFSYQFRFVAYQRITENCFSTKEGLFAAMWSFIYYNEKEARYKN